MTTALIDNQTLSQNLVAWFHHGRGCRCPQPPVPVDAVRAPGCALVICTYKRSQSLIRFLDSLSTQEFTPDQLIIVDASPDDETERCLQGYPSLERLASCVQYVRVSGPLMGLTRQRNFGVRFVATDLVAFFDDDIVLLPGCLQEMLQAHRQLKNEVAGVSAYMESSLPPDESRRARRNLQRLWRLRRMLGMVRSTRPGSYDRSGMPLPWDIVAPSTDLVEGDWLPGGVTMWKTVVVQDVQYYEGFSGYALGEDLDFSLRARRRGRLVVAAAARLRHLHEASGKPNHFELGYMVVHNMHQIHRRALLDRNLWDKAWFLYAWMMDTFILGRHFLVPRRWMATQRLVRGRLKALWDIAVRRSI